MSKDSLAQTLKEFEEEAKKYKTCMSLIVCEEGDAVELYLDTSKDTYSEWIKGEGADIYLMRCMETKKVMGVRLPLYKNNLCVHHKGPIRINAGFLKEEES